MKKKKKESLKKATLPGTEHILLDYEKELNS
jgi:hypothetical protein